MLIGKKRDMTRVLVTAMALVVVLFSLWYYYVDTLSLSEVVGDGGGMKQQMFVNLFDFDTGLTRHDVDRLKKLALEWERRSVEIAKIVDPAQREAAQDQLNLDILKDPTVKKISRKLFFGSKTALELVRLFK